MTLEDKIKDAEIALKLGAEMSLHYYEKPLIVTYSGGKDSDVMLHIARNCLKNTEFEVQNSHTTVDAPEYVKEFNLKMNPLYARGYKRVGCIGCPMGGAKHQRTQFSDYPKFKENYIRAFDRMIKNRQKRGLPPFMQEECMNTGEMVYRWWLGEDPKQVTFDDLLGGESNED